MSQRHLLSRDSFCPEVQRTALLERVDAVQAGPLPVDVGLVAVNSRGLASGLGEGRGGENQRDGRGYDCRLHWLISPRRS